MKKLIYLLVVLLFIISGCESAAQREEREEQERLYQQERLAQRLAMEEMIRCAEAFNLWIFNDEMAVDTPFVVMNLSTTDRFGNPADYEILFVHNEVAAAHYESETVVPAWPSIYTERIVYSLNHFIREDGVDVGAFGLQYPITTSDVIDHWENVRILRNSFDIYTQREISYLTFYIGRLFEEVSEEKKLQMEYAEFWWFGFLFDTREGVASRGISRAIPRIIREYAWHIEAYGVEQSEIIFVHTREEAEAYSSEIFVLYPRLVSAVIEKLESLNAHISSESIDLEEFSLTYPITETDLVDNWQNVSELMNSLDDDVLDRIRRGF